jgi:TPR repeat protein
VDVKAHRFLLVHLVFLASSSLGIAANAQANAATGSRPPLRDPLASGRSNGDLYQLLQSANHGDPDAKYELGIRYKVGDWAVRADPERALQWFEEASLAGVSDAMTQVGSLYEEGLGGPADPVEAGFWFGKARTAKNAGGTLALAEMHCQGVGTPKDIRECAALLDEAANDLKPSDSRYNLSHLVAVECVEMGRRYQAGDGIERDAAQADAWYARGGAMGDADGILAEAALSMALDTTHKNPERALTLLEDLATQRKAFGPDKIPLTGDQQTSVIHGLEAIAAIYEQRGGEEVAHAISVQIFLATLGRPVGAIGLASRYAQGNGVPRNPENAARLLKAVGIPDRLNKADSKSYWTAVGMLAEDYFTGRGAPKNVTKAIKLYESAAEGGNLSSSVALGLFYVEGTILPFDADEATSYLRRNFSDPSIPSPIPHYFRPTTEEIATLSPVDKRRFGKAARLLGERYEAGNGVRRDLFAARLWYRHGADAGDVLATAKLARIPIVVPKLVVPGEAVAGIGIGGVAGASSEVPVVETASAAPTPQPIVEERYPNVEAPDIVHPSQKFAVLVSLTGEQISPETRILSGNQRNGMLQIPMPPGMTSIVLEVNLSAPGMEFVDGSNIGQIELTAGQDSTVAQFHLRVSGDNATARPVKLMATFWYNHGFLARVARDIRVLPNDFARAPAELSEAIPAMAPSADPVKKTAGAGIVLQPEMASPDLTIIESRIGDTLHLTFMTRYASPVEATLPKASEMRAYIGTKFAQLARQGRGLTVESEIPVTRRGEDFARGFGDELFDRFTPGEFKQLYWRLRDAGIPLRTVQVLSDDPALPWELMRPAREGGQDRQDFWGLTARVARWQMGATGLPRPPQALRVNKMVVIAPHYAGALALDAAQQEAESLRGHEGFENVKGDYSDVRALASDLPDGIVHFAGHGVVRDENGEPQFSILLEDSELAPATWKSLAVVSRTHPFYFFNACEVGQARQAVGALDGWAPALLDSGASGYLGALWPVSDQVAGSFALNFYKILLENASAPVAEVVRQARQRTFDETHDPTALSYVLYADPFLEVRR